MTKKKIEPISYIYGGRWTNRSQVSFSEESTYSEANGIEEKIEMLLGKINELIEAVNELQEKVF